MQKLDILKDRRLRIKSPNTAAIWPNLASMNTVASYPNWNIIISSMPKHRLN